MDVQKHSYEVVLVNSYSGFDAPKTTRFTCCDDESLRTILAAYAVFYTGDPIECHVNGEKVVLEEGHGLLEATQ